MPRSSTNGIRRFFAVLAKNFGGLIKLNLLFCVCLLPSAALFTVGLFGLIPVIAFPLSVVTAIPAGGAYSACLFCIAKMLRDDPGYIWYDFKRKFKENVILVMPAGVLSAAVIYAQIYLLITLLYGGIAPGALWLAWVFVSLALICMTAPYIFLIAAYLHFSVPQIIRNGILLCFAHPGRSFLGMLAGGAIWIAFILFLPASLVFAPVIPLCGFSLSMLLSLMWIWPPVNQRFSIEERLGAAAGIRPPKPGDDS